MAGALTAAGVEFIEADDKRRAKRAPHPEGSKERPDATKRQRS
jgi:hypothetical protein